jgi:hypothetical protein
MQPAGGTQQQFPRRAHKQVGRLADVSASAQPGITDCTADEESIACWMHTAPLFAQGTLKQVHIRLL